MKLNKKIILPALSILAGASLIGSVSGTVAWYQYSTRTNVSYIGSSAGTIGNLQVRIRDAAGEAGEFGPSLSIKDVADYLSAQSIGYDVEPVTPGPLGKNDSLYQKTWKQLAQAANGDVAPVNGDGANGDYYFDTAESKLYKKANDEWAVVAATAAASDPNLANAEFGDLYVNTGDYKVYQAKIQLAWKKLAEATHGDVAPENENGANGDYYFDTAESKLYKKANNEWAVVAATAAASDPDLGGVELDAMYINTDSFKVFQAELAERNFYLNPQFGIASYDYWIKAKERHVVKLPLQLQFIGKNEQDLKAKDVYLSQLVIQADSDNAGHGDISDAIRVHMSAYVDEKEDAVNHLISKNGGTTLTHGKLKLGRGSDFDRAYDDEFGFTSQNYNYVNYGGDSGEQVCYGKLEDANAEAKYYEEEGLWNRIFGIEEGDVAPDNGDGENGDLYFDTVEKKLYKKENNAWEEKQYVSGTSDPNLNTENDGKDYYRNTVNGRFFLYVPAHNETVSPILVHRENNSLEITKLVDDKKIGTTVASIENDPNPQQYLNVDVTIWVEGWHKFNRNGSYSSIWDSNLIGAKFDVGFQFAVNDR